MKGGYGWIDPEGTFHQNAKDSMFGHLDTLRRNGIRTTHSAYRLGWAHVAPYDEELFMMHPEEQYTTKQLIALKKLARERGYLSAAIQTRAARDQKRVLKLSKEKVRYGYHVTSADKLSSIAEKGLIGGDGSSLGRTQPENSVGRVFITTNPQTLKRLYQHLHRTLFPARIRPVILRVQYDPTFRRPDTKYGPDAHSYFLEAHIPPHQVEVWHQRKWLPIAPLVDHTEDYLPPDSYYPRTKLKLNRVASALEALRARITPISEFMHSEHTPDLKWLHEYLKSNVDLLHDPRQIQHVESRRYAGGPTSPFAFTFHPGTKKLLIIPGISQKSMLIRNKWIPKGEYGVVLGPSHVHHVMRAPPSTSYAAVSRYGNDDHHIHPEWRLHRTQDAAKKHIDETITNFITEQLEHDHMHEV